MAGRGELGISSLGERKARGVTGRRGRPTPNCMLPTAEPEYNYEGDNVDFRDAQGRREPQGGESLPYLGTGGRGRCPVGH